jgi:predicted ester cyclase
MNARMILPVLLLVLGTGCASGTPISSTTPTCASVKSEVEVNKALLARYFDEVFKKRNPDALDGIVARDLVNHAAIPEAQGLEGLKIIHQKLFAAFPDMTIKPVDVIAEGDRAVVRAIVEGTQTGALEFKERLPATGRHLRIEHVYTYRIKDGRIVEMWMTRDTADFKKQLGLDQPPKKDGAS